MVLLSDTHQRHAEITMIGIQQHQKASAADIPLPKHCCVLSLQMTTCLLGDFLEDFCNDDGFIFCHCQVSHFNHVL